MTKKDSVTLGDMYGDLFKGVSVVEEDCGMCANDNISKSKKVPKQPKNAFMGMYGVEGDGPNNADGYHEVLDDPDHLSMDEDEESEDPITKLENKLKDDDLSDKDRKNITAELERLTKGAQNEEAEEDIVKECKKIAKRTLNKFMTKKSAFDELYESVMGEEYENQEIDALGLGDAPDDDEFGDGEFEDEGDQVTITLDRELANQLHEVLMGVLDEGGEEEGDLDFEDNFDDAPEEDMEEDDDEMSYDEDEENALPTDKVGNDGTEGHALKGAKKPDDGKNNKVKGKPQPKNQTTKVVGTTDKVGNDGDHGHALKGAKQPDMGKQNKVSDLRQAEDFFR